MLTEEVDQVFVIVCEFQVDVHGKRSCPVEEHQCLGPPRGIGVRPQAGASEKDDTPMVADMGHFHDEGGVCLEMGRDHDEDFRRNPANRGVVTIEGSTDHRQGFRHRFLERFDLRGV